MDPDEHLSAFMGGLEFALLAMEGRLRDGASDERLEAFVAEYRRIVEQYRARGGSPVASPLAVVVAAMGARHN